MPQGARAPANLSLQAHLLSFPPPCFINYAYWLCAIPNEPGCSFQPPDLQRKSKPQSQGYVPPKTPKPCDKQECITVRDSYLFSWFVEKAHSANRSFVHLAFVSVLRPTPCWSFIPVVFWDATIPPVL